MSKIESVYRGVMIAIFIEKCDARYYLMTRVHGAFDLDVVESSPLMRHFAIRKAMRFARSDIDKSLQPLQ